MIRFRYYSTDPAWYTDHANEYEPHLGEAEIPCGHGLWNKAAEGARNLELPEGVYVAVTVASDDTADVIGWGWLVQVGVETHVETHVHTVAQAIIPR